MAKSTKKTLEDAKQINNELEKAYENFYQYDSYKMDALHERTKDKNNAFYEIISQDSKNFIDPRGFSNSWLWDILYKETDRSFSNKLLKHLNKLIEYYQKNSPGSNTIVTEKNNDDSEKNDTFIVDETISEEKTDSFINIYEDNKKTNFEIDPTENVKKEISTLLKIKMGNILKKYKTILVYLFIFWFLIILYFLWILEDEDPTFFYNIISKILLIGTLITIFFGSVYIFERTNSSHVETSRIIIFIIWSIITIGLMVFGIRVLNLKHENELNTDKNNLVFVEDPAGLGIGTTSINFGLKPDLKDELDVNFMANSDTIHFKVFINYQNALKETLTNVKVKIDYPTIGLSKNEVITGELIADQGSAVIDKTNIVNLPELWRINLLYASCVSYNKMCSEKYYYDIPLDLTKLEGIEGASLPELDSYMISKRNNYSGACSQGHVIAYFQLIKMEL